METVPQPVTTTADDRKQLHPLVEDSGYMTPGNDGFEEYWHPLRFGMEGDKSHRHFSSGFEDRKGSATRVVGDMADSTQLSLKGSVGRGDSLAPTTEYMLDFNSKLRNFNNNDADFQELYNQAKVMRTLFSDKENNHIIYGDTDKPQYARVEHQHIVRRVWEDEAGQYDDFDQFLRENPQYS